MTKLRVEAYARTKSSGITAINSVWGDQMESLNIVWNGNSDATRMAHLLEPGVNGIRGEFHCCNSNLRSFEKCLETKLFAVQAVACTHYAYVVVREQALPVSRGSASSTSLTFLRG